MNEDIKELGIALHRVDDLISTMAKEKVEKYFEDKVIYEQEKKQGEELLKMKLDYLNLYEKFNRLVSL